MTGKRRVRVSLFLVLVLNVAILHAATDGAAAAAPGPASGVRPSAVTARPAGPLAFERNVGQTDPRARYIARSRGYTVFVTADGPLVRLRGAAPARESAVRLRWVGGSPTPAISAIDELPGRSNYLVGTDRSRWRTAVPTFSRVRYTGVYDGIDVDLYGRGKSLEYDLRVAPGADPSRARLAFEGADAVRVDADGTLVVATAAGEIRQPPAVVYQTGADGPRAVAARYTATASGEVGLALGAYDAARPLVIDPVLVFAEPIGGSAAYDEGDAIAVDGDGAAYVAGTTAATDFPAATGYDRYQNGGRDAFVAKVSPDGSSVLWSTYLGGSGDDAAYGIALGPDGRIWVAGSTTSAPGAPFPTTAGAYDATPNGLEDVFVAKLAADGSSLVASTLVGGDQSDVARSVAAGADGSVYVTGETKDSPNADYPTTPGAPGATVRGLSDAFVTRLNASLSSLLYSTLVGGDASDSGEEVAVDGAGHAYVAGTTRGPGFPTTPGAFDTSYGGLDDAFVFELAADGTGFVYSTLLGGSSADDAYGLALDASGDVFAVGNTGSVDFPATPGAFDTTRGQSYDAFVAKLSADGSSLVYASYLGGASNYNRAYDVAVDAAGEAYVVGETWAPDFPATSGAFDETFDGVVDGFAAKVSADGSTLLYASYLGGARTDRVDAVAVDAAGAAYLTGYEESSDFPRVAGFARPGPDKYDAFVAKVAPSGAALAYSSVLGGTVGENVLDEMTDVALGLDGGIYATGYTESVAFPTTVGAVDRTNDAPYATVDAFVVHMSADGATLLYSTFLGGTGIDQAHAVAVDAAGAAYVVGSTNDAGFPPDFPVTPGAFDTSADQIEAFVAKLSPDGASLDYATYLGGTGNDDLKGIRLYGSGAAVVVGSTDSPDYPTTAGAYDTTVGYVDAVVTKIAPDGRSLVFSTVLGGPDTDRALGVALGNDGNLFVCGVTSANDGDPQFPTTAGAFDTTYAGSSEAFVARLAADGSSLVYATYLGGSSTEQANAIEVDPSGFAYVTGVTSSSDFPTTPGAPDATLDGDTDLFVSKVSQNGTALVYSTLLGGTGGDAGTDVAVGADRTAYLTGYSEDSSVDFPTTPDAVSTTNAGDVDAILTQVSADGSTLVYSTFLGGQGNDRGTGIALGSGSVVVVGDTGSFDFGAGGFGGRDGLSTFVAKLTLPGAAAPGADTAGVYVGSTGAWFLKNTNAPGPADLSFFYGSGGQGFVALRGDWDGDGTDTVGLYLPSSSTFFLKNTNAGGSADLTFTFGVGGLGYVPVTGDWDGDGVDTIGLYQPATGQFFLRNANASGPADLSFFYGPGGLGWTPLAGDWDGDGTDTVGLYSPADGFFFLKNTNSGGPADLSFPFGPGGLGWVALSGDYDGNGTDTVGVYAPENGVFFLRNTNAPGAADLTFGYGPPGVTPLVGDWDGQ